MSYFSLSFGGCYTSICAVNGSKKNFISDNDNTSIPSCMFFTGTEFLCGTPAFEKSIDDPQNTVCYLSRLASIKPSEASKYENSFNPELKATGDTISLKFGDQWFKREELLDIYFQYLASVIGRKANLEKGILALDEQLPVESYKLIILTAKNAGFTFLRVVTNSYAALALNHPKVAANQYILVIDLYNDFTISIYDSSYKLLKTQNFNVTCDVFTETLISIIKQKLSKGKNKVNITEIPESMQKARYYSHVIAYKFLTQEKIHVHIPQITPDHTYSEDLTQTKVFIYVEESIDNLSDAIKKFFDDIPISPENLVSLILMNHAKQMSYVGEFMKDKYESINISDYNFFTGLAEGATIVAEDTSKYPNYIVQPNGNVTPIDRGGERAEFTPASIAPPGPAILPAAPAIAPASITSSSDSSDEPSPPKRTPTHAPEPAPPHVDHEAPSRISRRKVVVDDIDDDDDQSINSISKLNAFIHKLSQFSDMKASDPSTKPAFIRSLNFQINNAREWCQENPDATPDSIKNFVEPIEKQVKRLFKDWTYP